MVGSGGVVVVSGGVDGGMWCGELVRGWLCGIDDK